MKPEEKKKRWKKAEEAINSRKEQKRLEKIRFRRKSKLDRGKLLAELKQCQLTNEQVDQLHTTASMQTRGLKRFMADDQNDASNVSRMKDTERAEKCLDAALLLARKKPRRSLKEESTSASSSEDTDAISSDNESESETKQESTVVEQESKVNDPDSGLREETTSKIVESNVNDSQLVENIEKIKESISQLNQSTEQGESNKERERAIFVPVNRDPEIDKTRLKLPIINEEQNIVETIRYNDVVIISGETGSGKTTQIPQFLYEAGYASNGRLIGITEPRRVAAISMSERVSKELNLTQDEVSYQIRFDTNISARTMIKFLTDGVLMRECQQDFLLSKYSVIIIDEAHERSIFSDILIGLLSRIVPLRRKQGNPLKLIIMSATLRVDDFLANKHLFKIKPPLINIESRQYKVTAHFAKVTPSDYLAAAYKKVRAINSKMPKGGILVFVTSRVDVKVLCKKLSGIDLHCVALYAMLPMKEQKLVFKDPPDNKRLCVIATNVAETSITIPNIRYVVDTGKEKRKIYDLHTGVSKFVTDWTSKSSANQRMGRAGRMGPGSCYRLYSSAVFTNNFHDFGQPAILSKPVEDIVLQMKSMNIDNVVNFPFPTRPSLEALMEAEKKLISLGALDDSKIKTARYCELNKVQYTSRLTPLGKAMSSFAVSPRYSKMIVLSPAHLIKHIVALVSALTVREMFLSSNQWQKIKKKWSGQGECKLLGDFGVMLRAVCQSDTSNCSSKDCNKYGIRTKAMLEIFKLREQLLKEVQSNFNYNEEDSQMTTIVKPSDVQASLLRQLLLSSFGDHVARKIPDGEITERNRDDPNKINKKKLKNAYECMETESIVYIDSQSVLKGSHPEYVIYKELVQGEKKMYMRDLCVIDPTWLPHYSHKMCHFSDKTTSDHPRYDRQMDQIICTRSTTYGPMNWPLGIIEVPMHLLDTGVEIYKHFASFLLAGEVFPWFKKYVSDLLSPPSMMTKPWSKLQPRTSKFLNALLSNNVKTKKDLIGVWIQDKECKYIIQ